MLVQDFRRLTIYNRQSNLAFQQSSSMPKTTNPQTARMLNVLAKAYETLAERFQECVNEEGNVNRLLSEIGAGQEIWLKVCNITLASNHVLEGHI